MWKCVCVSRCHYSSDGFVKLNVNQWHKRSRREKTWLNRNRRCVITPAHVSCVPFDVPMKHRRDVCFGSVLAGVFKQRSCLRHLDPLAVDSVYILCKPSCCEQLSGKYVLRCLFPALIRPDSPQIDTHARTVRS